MRNPRIYTETPLSAGTEVTLCENASRHVARVLRLRKGDELRLFDGRGGEYQSRITSLAAGRVSALAETHALNDVESPLRIHLHQAIVRGERMDYVIQKATELGVDTITPLLTEYCVVRLDRARGARRTAHWTKIAIGACEQCGRNRLPTIAAPARFEDFLDGHQRSSQALLLVPGAENRFAASTVSAEKALHLLIGPEGGFSDHELERARNSEFAERSLGPRVLRAETATVTALSVAQGLWGDLGARD